MYNLQSEPSPDQERGLTGVAARMFHVKCLENVGVGLRVYV